MRFSILCLLCVTAYATVCATDSTDFSGTYTLAPRKESAKSQKQIVKTLTVVQTDSSIEVREVEAGRTNTNRYPLGDQQGSYVSPGGLEGTCKRKLGKKSLILESFVNARLDPKGPPVQIHTKQKYLSGVLLAAITSPFGPSASG
jgi:hypothetical protein